MLRFGKQGNWRSAERAEKDLRLRASDSGLSLYRVYSLEEARTVAEIFALVCRKQGPLDIFGVLIPSICFQFLTLEPRAYEDLPPFLNDRHNEIPRAQLSSSVITALAANAFSHSERSSISLAEEEVRAAALFHIENPSIRPLVSVQWLIDLGLEVRRSD